MLHIIIIDSFFHSFIRSNHTELLFSLIATPITKQGLHTHHSHDYTLSSVCV